MQFDREQADEVLDDFVEGCGGVDNMTEHDWAEFSEIESQWFDRGY